MTARTTSPEAFALSVTLETAIILRDTLADQLDQVIDSARDAVATIDNLPAAERRRITTRYRAALEALNQSMRQATRVLRGEPS